MLRKLALIGLLPLLLAATPAAAITAKDKAETCKIGADDQKLEGDKRKIFLAKCMGNGNYEPKARKDALKKAAIEKKKLAGKKMPPPPTSAAPAAAPEDDEPSAPK